MFEEIKMTEDHTEEEYIKIQSLNMSEHFSRIETPSKPLTTEHYLAEQDADQL